MSSRKFLVCDRSMFDDVDILDRFDACAIIEQHRKELAELGSAELNALSWSLVGFTDAELAEGAFDKNPVMQWDCQAFARLVAEIPQGSPISAALLQEASDGGANVAAFRFLCEPSREAVAA